MAIVNNNENYPTDETKLSPFDTKFINKIMNRLTGFGQLPYKIPQDMIIDVIENSANWFYDNDYRAVKQSYYHINVTDIPVAIKNDNYVTVVVPLNNRIRIVKMVYDATTRNNFDLSSAMYLSSNVGGAQGFFQSSIDNNLTILEAATKMIERRVIDMTFGGTIPFEYISATCELILKTQPQNNIILDTSSKLEVQHLYKVQQFYDHVLSKCRGELRRILGSHTIELPGGVTMSPDEICKGDEDWVSIEEKVKNANGLGDIIMKRN